MATTDSEKANESKGDHITITIGSGARQVAAGKQVNQNIGSVGPTDIVSDAELQEVTNLFQELRSEIGRQVPSPLKEGAQERVNEVEETIVSGKADVPTIVYVRNWFSKHVPQLAGVLVSVLVNPIIGKIVEAAGELAADEFRERIGNLKS